MNLKSAFFPAVMAAGLLSSGVAAVIGMNGPANPLTAGRVAALPAWKAYFVASVRQRLADQAFIRDELTAHGLKQTALPHETRNALGVPLDHAAQWYAGAEARRLADNLVSFQTPAGGWSKNTDFTRGVRAPGEMFGAENGSLFLGPDDFDRPKEAKWSYVGTFDNDATTTELRFLAKVIAATPAPAGEYGAAFARGLHYVLAAQFPNGGWPQVWPLQGGYHDAVTLNDDAMLHIIEFLQDVAGGRNDFAFVPAGMRAQAEAAWRHGLDCLLAAQIVANGRRTVWCQQHDAITLQPASARNFEMPAACSSESAEIVLFLMRLPNPTAGEVAAVHAAVAWFEKTKMAGKAFRLVGAGRQLVDEPGARPIWARYYAIGTDQPVFGDRDKSIHDNLDEISPERRNGYAWFRDTPGRVLEHYAKWAKQHPPADR